MDAMKYVSPLLKSEREKLNDILKNDLSFRARTRAQAVLLSDRGYGINNIADILQVGRDTVSSWIDAWERSGPDALSDRPRSGRPAILAEDEKKTAEKLIGENPRSPRAVIQKLFEITGKIVSPRTVRRLAKTAGLIWKRVRKTVRPKRNEAEFKKAKKEIGELKKQQEKGEIDLYSFDESGFDLQSSVPYARQPKGETIEIPSFRSPRLNVLGFLNTKNNEFHCFTFECSVDSDVVTACFDEFSEIITKKTVVIFDNSSSHTSEEFMKNIEKWEKKGLFVKYLPPYSPELNPIEILWRFIKYLWLPFSAYTSFRNLVEEVEKVLKGIGSEYIINFS